MPIRAFLPDSSFDPETIALMSRAFETALGQLCDCATSETRETIAVLIIAAARAGERDVPRLAAAGLRFAPRREPDNTKRRTG